MHRDVVFVCPFLKSRHDNWLGMMGIAIYGINSHGRNQIYGFGFLNDQYDEYTNYEFIFSNFAYYMEKPPKLIMMSWIIAAGFKSDNLYKAILKVYGKQILF